MTNKEIQAYTKCCSKIKPGNFVDMYLSNRYGFSIHKTDTIMRFIVIATSKSLITLGSKTRCVSLYEAKQYGYNREYYAKHNDKVIDNLEEYTYMWNISKDGNSGLIAKIVRAC